MKEMASLQHPLIFGVPRWMYRKGFRLCKKWILAELLGKNAYREYCVFQEMIGTMKAMRSLARTT